MLCGADASPMQALYDAMFSRCAIVNTISSMIHTVHKIDADAFCIVFLNCFNRMVSFGIDKEGFCPFANEPLVRMPFTSMNKGQLQAVQRALQHSRRMQRCVTCSSMNSGFFARALEFEVRLDPRDVIFALEAILQRLQNGNLEPEHWALIAPTIRRRLFASTVLPSCVLLEAQALAAEDGGGRGRDSL